MRKVRLDMNVSLDGYVAGPDGELDWVFGLMDSAQAQLNTDFPRDCDVVRLGRVTHLPPTANHANGRARVVFSKAMGTLNWSDAQLARAVAEEIARLKQQPGKDIVVTGGVSLAQSLSRSGLIDEYHLTIHPIVLGSGLSLFKDVAEPFSLKLVSARTCETGAILVTYESATATERQLAS
jgi:dihydrofolate reductase